jgi:hypothetical protein
MPDYKYILEPYSGRNSRYTCPSCRAKRTFTRYINTQTNEQVGDTVGRCNRVDNCGYHYTPKQFFIDNGSTKLTNLNISRARARIMPETKRKEVSYIPPQIFKASLSAYDENCFIHYLHNFFGRDIALQLADTYHIGSSKHWQGATVFWQMDIQDRVRTGKVMLYSPATGKRVKEPYNCINWVHALKDRDKKAIFPDYQLKQCFFGEHLLTQHPNKPVALVESEKTAIIASVYLPQFLWLATGGKEGMNEEKCVVLKNRKVVLFPDLKCYDKWNDIKKMLVQVSISDFLENKATAEEKALGLDIADYLLRFDYRAFNKTPVIHALPEVTEEQDMRLEAIDINTVFDNHISTQHIAQAICNTPTPFEGCTGRVYLPTPGNPSRYAVYVSIIAYNERRHLPEYVDKPSALQDRCKDLVLDYKELQLKHSVP